MLRAHGLGEDGQGDGSRAVVRQETVAVVQVNMRRGWVKVAAQQGMDRSGSTGLGVDWLWGGRWQDGGLWVIMDPVSLCCVASIIYDFPDGKKKECCLWNWLNLGSNPNASFHVPAS